MNFKNIFDSSIREVFFNSILSALLKGFALGLGLLLNIYIGKKIGADDLGVFNLLIQIINFSSVIVILGIPQLLIKNLSRHLNDEKIQEAFVLLRNSLILVTLASLALIVIFQLFPEIISNYIFKESKLTTPLKILSLSLLFISIAKIVSAFLIAKGIVWQGYLFEQALSIFIITIVFLMNHLGFISFEINIYNISIVFLVAYIITMLLSFFTSIRVFYKMKSNTLSLWNTLKESSTFYYISLTSVIYSSMDIFMISYFLEAKDVAYYSAALKLATLSIFLLQITNSVMMPKISTLYHSNQIEKMVTIVKKVNLILSIVGVLFFLALVIFGKYLLSLWGQEFTNSYNCLLIIAFGQLINVLTGPVGVILLMSVLTKPLDKIAIFK